MCEEDTFITLVEANRALWDKKRGDYKNTTLREKIWEEIDQQSNLTGKEAAALFSSLRLKYIRRKNEEKNMQRSESAAKLLKTWNLQDQLRFLDDTITSRKTVCNLLQEKTEVSLKNVANPPSERIDAYLTEPLPGCSEFSEECNMSRASEESLPIMSPSPETEAHSRSMLPVRNTPTPSTSGIVQRKTNQTPP